MQFHYEEWADLCELSTELLESVETITTNMSIESLSNDISRGNIALHLDRPDHRHYQDVHPLVSTILRPVICDASKCNINNVMSTFGDDNNDPVLFIHPFLFQFLTECSLLVTTEELQQTQSTALHPNSPKEKETDTSKEIRVRIEPFPFEPISQYFDSDDGDDNGNGRLQGYSHRRYGWRLRAVPVSNRNTTSIADDTQQDVVLVSCIFVGGFKSYGYNSNRRPTIETIFAEALEGRVIMPGCAILINILNGCAILKIESIFIHNNIENLCKNENENDNARNMAYRLGSLDTFQVQIRHIGDTLLAQTEGNEDIGVDGFNQREDIWVKNIPGYEGLLGELLQLLNAHGSPAAPSGVLLSGCSGVGKSRLASCLGHHYISQCIRSNRNIDISTTKKKRNSTYRVSVHDLFFRAATTNDLFQEIIFPRLQHCSVWIIDDLTLLEQKSSSSNGDDDGGDEVTQRSVEYKNVLNAIIHGIDFFRTKRRILGICRTVTNLPKELTKPGRLEKVVQMLAPTQLQRQDIWSCILSQDFVGTAIGTSDITYRDQCLSTLVATTAGCVAADMIRVYQTARTRALARSSEIEWEDLREAARSNVPSQLAELDVTMPRTFGTPSTSISWAEIHQLSWEQFGGYDEIKKQVYRNVVSPWRNFLQRIDSLASDGEKCLTPPSGIIFHGPSGCGKTMAARCMADSLQMPMVQIRATDVLNKYLGGSEALLRSFFARARAASPCIILIDEIDSISNNRSEDDTNELGSRILSTLLNEMDGISSIKNNRAFVVACSNRLGAIDSALLRSGRLEEHIYIGPPSRTDLEQILRLQTNRMPLDEQISMYRISRKLFEIGATPADVNGLCREVCFIAFRRMRYLENTLIIPKDFDDALKRLGNKKQKTPGGLFC